jgi:uncharacterized protein YndB with AHSA1/START domain
MSIATSVLIEPSLTLKRRLKAAPAEVYAAWTDPKKIVKWFGPEQIETLRAHADARVGGGFRIVMRSPDGEEHDVSGIYREVVPNEKLVFTWAWRSTPERESIVTSRSSLTAAARCSPSFTRNSSTRPRATATKKAGPAASTSSHAIFHNLRGERHGPDDSRSTQRRPRESVKPKFPWHLLLE